MIPASDRRRAGRRARATVRRSEALCHIDGILDRVAPEIAGTAGSRAVPDRHIDALGELQQCAHAAEAWQSYFKAGGAAFHQPTGCTLGLPATLAIGYSKL
jgi:hypothetical protein